MEHHEVAPERVAQIKSLCQQGLFCQAYEAGKSIGPLVSWSGADAALLATRLAEQLGSSCLARWLDRRAYRRYPDHDNTKYYHAHYLARARGPYAAWRWMHDIGEPRGEGSDAVRADWYALLGDLAAIFRDFDVARHWLDRALALDGDRPWLSVCQATILEREDRYQEALAAAEEAMRLQPWYCPAVESATHLLTLLDRESEAVEMLDQAMARTECSRLAGQLYAIRLERRQYREAGEALDRCAALAVLADKKYKQWLAGQRAELAYRTGDVAAAVEYAKLAGRGFFETIAERLQDPSRAEAGSVLLPVGFVRQHHVTCVPATLSAISRYWRKPADHLEVAEDICYDGTPAHHERKWAENHGWVVREFTVTERSAAELLDRGIPFTFTTVSPGNSHLQAVIGYDGRRGTFWIRDSFWHNTQEAIADKLLKANCSYGPRGMALVPSEEQSRLDGLDLPDAALWDGLHELDHALMGNRREEAGDICRRLATDANGGRIGIEARRRLAYYDGNSAEHLIAVEELLKLTPDGECLQLERLGCLRETTQREQRMAIYRQLCDSRNTHPIFLQQYAQELKADARRHTEAVRLLQIAMSRMPTDASNYYILAGILWNNRRFEESLELYRFAACVNDKEESFAESYFIAAQWFKKTEEAFGFLRRRFEQFGRKSGRPACTLARAYLQWNRTADALELLEEARRLRPDDAELSLYTADAYLSCSREKVSLASSLIEEVKGTSPPAYWLRTAARLASREGKPAEALQLWRQLLQFQPLAIDAHQAVVGLLAETEGTAAALTHLDSAVDQFPHHVPLHGLRLEWLRSEPPEVREPAIRLAISVSPHDAWLQRELAFFLAEQRRTSEAWEVADVAGRLERSCPAYHFLRAGLLRDEGKIDGAKSELREAIRLSVDYEQAIQEWTRLCSTLAERREALTFVKEELVRQVSFGDGLLVFRQEAQGTLEAGELLATLQDALRERPDLWHAWSACVQQLLSLDRRNEAWELACRATDRFPLLPALWLDLAAACHARHDWSGEREALETAYQINPDWGNAIRELADFHERQGEFAQAKDLLERAAIRLPLDVNNQIMLAEMLWRRDRREDALEAIRRVVELDPRYERAWADLGRWAAELGRQALAIDVARSITECRGGEAQSWIYLAEALNSADQLDERLAALDRAAILRPRGINIYDLRATLLAEAGRWNEASEACRPPVWGDHSPVQLRGRLAWLQSQQHNLSQAIEDIRAVLAEEPSYWAGWCWLWSWCCDVGDFRGCLAAAEAICRIAPQYEVSLGYLGEAKRLNNDPEGAYTAFEQAFALNPSYEYAGNALFDLQLSRGELRKAEVTLRLLQRHNPSAGVCARAVQLASRGHIVGTFEAVIAGAPASHSALAASFATTSPASAGDVADVAGGDVGARTPSQCAEYHLRSLCKSHPTNGEPLAAAVDAMVAGGLRREARKVLEEALSCEESHPEVGRQWVKLCIAQNQWWRCLRRLNSLMARGSTGIDAVVAYLEALGNSKRKWQFQFFFRRGNREWIRKYSKAWGTAGRAMLCFNHYGRLCRWMADWRERADATPWMLLNLSEGFRALRRDAEAAEVTQFALTLTPDHTTDSHYVWAAVDAISCGNIAEAKRLLSRARSKVLNEYFSVLRELVLAVIEMESSGEGDRTKAFHSVRKKMRGALARHREVILDRARRPFYRKCLLLIAKRQGGFAGKWWLLTQWMSS